MSILITILEVGSNVIVSGSGSANTSSLTSSPVSDQGANIIADISLVTLYGVNTSVDSYTGLIAAHPNIGPGNGGPNYSFNRTGNNSFGISEQGDPTKVAYLYLPTGYISNSDLGTSTATYTNKSFTTLGLTRGTYTWTWGSGGNADSLTVQIGDPSVTPTPTVTSTNTPTNTSTTTTTPTVTNTSSPAGVTATPTVTATNTTTPSVTPTNTTTPSVTPTNTLTPTKTATPSVTPTNTPTPSNTPGVCKTYQLYGGTGDTTFVGRDCNGFTFTLQVQAYQTLVQCATEVYIVDGNGSYLSIGSCPLPTPTPSITASVTPSVTATPTLTPTTTTTLTLTPTKTATNTPTPTLTQTQTQTGTAAVTPSATTTKTPTLTPTNTATPSVTPTNTMTPTNTGTPAVTPTKTSTPTVTSTPTGTPPATPTPTPTFFFTGFSADQQYAYTIDILGGFSGGTAPDGAIAPHPIFTDENGVPVQQLNGITLGGFNGLNN
jgi:hypothetical protein